MILIMMIPPEKRVRYWSLPQSPPPERGAPSDHFNLIYCSVCYVFCPLVPFSVLYCNPAARGGGGEGWKKPGVFNHCHSTDILHYAKLRLLQFVCFFYINTLTKRILIFCIVTQNHYIWLSFLKTFKIRKPEPKETSRGRNARCR